MDGSGVNRRWWNIQEQVGCNSECCFSELSPEHTLRQRGRLSGWNSSHLIAHRSSLLDSDSRTITTVSQSLLSHLSRLHILLQQAPHPHPHPHLHVEQQGYNNLAEEAASCLSLLQGLSLSHGVSKQLCGRKSALEVSWSACQRIGVSRGAGFERLKLGEGGMYAVPFEGASRSDALPLGSWQCGDLRCGAGLVVRIRVADRPTILDPCSTSSCSRSSRRPTAKLPVHHRLQPSSK